MPDDDLPDLDRIFEELEELPDLDSILEELEGLPTLEELLQRQGHDLSKCARATRVRRGRKASDPRGGGPG